MSIEQAQPQTPRPPTPNGQPETWVYLADWPLPPEGRKRVEVELREHRYSRKEIASLEECAKVVFFFGGRWIATTRISGRRVVLWAGDGGFADGARFLRSLSSDMQSKVLIEYVNDPNEPLPEMI